MRESVGVTPQQIDKIICAGSMQYGVAMYERALNALVDALVLAANPLRDESLPRMNNPRDPDPVAHGELMTGIDVIAHVKHVSAGVLSIDLEELRRHEYDPAVPLYITENGNRRYALKLVLPRKELEEINVHVQRQKSASWNGWKFRNAIGLFEPHIIEAQSPEIRTSGDTPEKKQD